MILETPADTIWIDLNSYSTRLSKCNVFQSKQVKNYENHLVFTTLVNLCFTEFNTPQLSGRWVNLHLDKNTRHFGANQY